MGVVLCIDGVVLGMGLYGGDSWVMMGVFGGDGGVMKVVVMIVEWYGDKSCVGMVRVVNGVDESKKIEVFKYLRKQIRNKVNFE